MTSHARAFDCNEGNFSSNSESQTAQPSLDFNAVHGFSTQLANSTRDNIGQTLSAIDNYVNAAPELRQDFFDCLNSDLMQSQKLGQVMSNFAHSQYQDQYGRVNNTYDFLRNGHKRASDQDLAQDARYYNSNGMAAEGNLVQNMLGQQPDIEKAHYEGAFLGMGGPVTGVDSKRLDKYAKNEERVREAGDIPQLFGMDSNGYIRAQFFYDLAQGKGYITKDDIKQAIVADSLRPAGAPHFDDQHMAALVFMRDNFGKVADYSVDPNNKTVNAHSLLHFAKKQHVTVASDYDYRYNYD